jgi:hypothetical protein
MKISRRAFHTALLSTPALAQGAAQKLVLPAWNGPSTAGDAFALTSALSPRQRWNVPGPPRKYFSEWLPALFERTLEIDEWKGEKSQLHWIFTGPLGGFTVEVGAGRLRLAQRYFDSPGLSKVPPVAERPARHPEGLWEESSVEYTGDLRAVTVVLDHRLSVRVALNGKEALVAHGTLDVNRHQAAWAGEDGGVRGRLLPPVIETATVRVDPSDRFQEMLGFGGTTTPPAYAELSREGKRVWWRKLAEYNLLLHREYPTGALLNPEMTNWDRPSDASPHYYGDNFPNCETSDFDYMRRVRRLGGKVIFEFWELPVWARRRDSAGKLTELPDLDAYAKAMVRYCQVSREKTGAAPEIVGIQNEVQQPPEVWQQMTLALRQALDRAGFGAVKIHMHNAPYVSGGIAAAKAFREKDAVWKAIDYATSNMYDYQDFFYDPDGFDARLREMKETIGGKPFLATELCVNNGAFQTRSYRTAFAMGQLYHKVLTTLDTCGIMYCWTLLNVVQPSYGWTRTLMAPDAEHGLTPAATSHQLRVYGAYSRRIRAGMTRVQAASSSPQLLATAFSGNGGARTLVMMNRSTAAQSVSVTWPGEPFRYMEVVSPQQENAVEPMAAGEVTVPPGAIVTLTNVPLGQASDDFLRA